MSEKNKDSLLLFMKKQVSEKSSKNNLDKKSATKNSKAKTDKSDKESKKDDEKEEMTEEEQLEDAKKASRNKTAGTDQTDMIKKLILESIVKYTVLISVLVIFAIGLIKFGPALLAMLNSLFYKIIMSAFAK